jgi:subtilisin family serine protease
MSRPPRLLVALLLALLLAPAGLALPTRAAPAAQGAIVALKDTADPGAVAGELGGRHGFVADFVYRHALRGFAAVLSAQAQRDIARDPRVAFVAPDRPAEVYAQELPTGIDRIDAEQNSTAAIDGRDERIDVDVAVIDTGSGPHPDLNVVGGVDCTKQRNATYRDTNGHGTHVAGTVGAFDNGIGVVGVAPGARIWSVKVFDGPRGATSEIICGIDWVTSKNGTAEEIEVANMSLGGFRGDGADDGDCGRTNQDPMHVAICASVDTGVTYVVAAGNSADDAARHVPASYDEVVTVSALLDTDGKTGGMGPARVSRIARTTTPDDSLAPFSNYGRDVDIAAPGVDIRSTFLSNSYTSYSGTSMASPHVAGAVALGIARFDRELDPIPGDRICGMPGDPDGINEGILKVAGDTPGCATTATAATAAGKDRAGKDSDGGRDQGDRGKRGRGRD